MKVFKTAVVETMLIPLWARAVEQYDKEPIIIDNEAEKIMNKLGYDLNYLDKKKQNPSQVGCCIRGKWIDDRIEDFLSKHNVAQVIQLGAGLDNRYKRIKQKEKIDTWYDLDLPEAIKIRQNVIEQEDKVKYFAMDMFNEEWMKELSSKKLPTIIVIEGVLMYFQADKVKELFKLISKHFPATTIIFDSIPAVAIHHAKYHDSLGKLKNKNEFNWGLKEPSEILKYGDNIKIEKFDYMAKLPMAKKFNLLIKFFKLLGNKFSMQLYEIKLS